MTQIEMERPNTFRAVVDGVDRHGVRVADEFQSFGYATARRDLKLKAEEVVELARRGTKYEVQQVLPYQYVESVSHPHVPGLRGVPLADIGHPTMFSVRGRTYVRKGEEAHSQVQSWFFESTEAEAGYVGSLLMGGLEIPDVQLSDIMRERLAALGAVTENLERMVEEQRKVQRLRQALKTEATASATNQRELQQEVALLNHDKDQVESAWKGFSEQAQKAEENLKVFLAGIDEAEKEQERVLQESKTTQEEAEKERKRILSEAQRDARKIGTAANQRKTEAEAEAEAIRTEARVEAAKLQTEGVTALRLASAEAQEVSGRAKVLQQVLERQADRSHGAARQEGRKPYGPAEEVPALQAALQNLKQARGTTAEQLVALHVALKHTPFTVLAGSSGSGKTSLVLAYARQMGIHVTTVAVQPGWTSVQDLHGYVNPLRPGEYRSTPFFEALGYQVRQSQAAKLRDLLHGSATETLANAPDLMPLDLVLLDEINLSPVEYFLADYLSAFELDNRNVAVTTSDEAMKLALAKDEQVDDAHPLAWLRHLGGQLDVPRSFLIAGTANEDGTTFSFTDILQF